MADKWAGELFKCGYNCAQSVFAASADKLGIDTATALKLSAPLGAGVGRMREVCGAFSACAMLMGLKYASTEPTAEKKEEIYKRTQELAAEFKKLNGSIICRDILKLQKDAPTPPTPDARTAEYYAKRPCLRVVENADMLVKKFIEG